MSEEVRRDVVPPGQQPAAASSSNLRTYTAGEDMGRLADAARSMGLASHRAPRRPVRDAAAGGGGDGETARPGRSGHRRHGGGGGRHHHHHRHRHPRRHGGILGAIEDVGLLFAGDTAASAAYYGYAGYRVDADGRVPIEPDAEAAKAEAAEPSRPEKQPSLLALFRPHSPAVVDDEEEASATETSVSAESESDEEEMGDPHLRGGGGTLTAAVLGIIKGMIGPAILFVPHGFATAGYLVALPMMAAATAMYVYSSACLLECWRQETTKVVGAAGGEGSDEEGGSSDEVAGGEEEMVGLLTDEGTRRMTALEEGGSTTPASSSQSLASSAYGATADGSGGSDDLPSSPRSKSLSYPYLAYLAFGTRGEQAVMVGITLMQSSVCLMYLIFVPQNLHSSLYILFGVRIPMGAFLFFMVLIELPLSWIRDIRRLTYTNFLANALILYGWLACIGFAFGEAGSKLSSGRAEEVFGSLTAVGDGWYLFVGKAVLLFEGSITLCVPLQEAVVGCVNREEFPSVYRRTILSLVGFYAFFALTCWAAFGDGVDTILTKSLPAGDLASSVQFAYSVAVIFTFPLQNFPALEISCRSIASLAESFSRSGKEEKEDPVKEVAAGTTRRRSPLLSVLADRSLIASVMVCLLALVAHAAMDSLGNVVSLTGAMLGCPIAFTFPPLIHNRVVKKSSATRRAINHIVAALGIVAGMVASVSTVATWGEGDGR